MSVGTKIKNFIFSKKFLINLVLIAVTYVLVVFISNTYLNSFTNHGEKINVPDLIGKNIKGLDATLDELNLKYEISETVYDPTKPDGTIISQDPLPSKESQLFVKEERIIRVKTSKKTQLVEVPNCIDKSQRFAENILKNRGLKYRIEYKPSVESAGAVMEQRYNGKSIAGKEKVTIGSTITLIVGKGSSGQEFSTPNLVDLTICDVKSRLSVVPVNLVIICDNCITSADSCSAIVYSQSPEYFESAIMAGGSTITVHATK